MTATIHPEPSEGQRDTNAMWRRNFVAMAALAAILAIMLFATLVSNRQSAQRDREVLSCRSSLAAEQDAALADVMVGIGVAVGEVDPAELDRPLSEALVALDDTEEARRMFNEDSSLPCPLP